MTDDFDQEVAALAAKYAKKEQLDQLAQELRRLGARWKAARGNRRSLPEQHHPTFTDLEQAIVKAVAAGMSEYQAAAESRVSRTTVRAMRERARLAEGNQAPTEDTPNGASA